MRRPVWTSAVVLMTAVLLSLAVCMPAFAQGGGTGDPGDRDCSDFSSQEEAQDFFESEGGPEEDPHGLDADNDGQACEDSDFGGGDGDVPEGGIDSGSGPTTGPKEEDGASPFALGALALVVVGVGLGTTAVRRRTG